jgi:ABC-type proline/glycine betaine transport system permease subunit
MLLTATAQQIPASAQQAASFFFSILQKVFRSSTADISVLLLCLIFIMFLVYWFYTMLSLAIMFSKHVIVLISIGLGVVFASTGVVAKLIEWLVSLVGPIITFIIIVGFFTSSYFLEKLSLAKIRKKKEWREQLEKLKGEKILEEFGKQIK